MNALRNLVHTNIPIEVGSQYHATFCLIHTLYAKQDESNRPISHLHHFNRYIFFDLFYKSRIELEIKQPQTTFQRKHFLIVMF